MRLSEALVEVWRQAMVDQRTTVELEGRRYEVGQTRARRLRAVAFGFGDRAIEGIEQNPATSSRWAQLAQAGQRVMQFSSQGRYFANVAEGTLTRYPAWRELSLPE